MKPRIGILPGDPSGIGPELIARLLADPKVTAAADLLLIGDAHVFAAGQAVAGEAQALTPLDARTANWTSAAPLALHAMTTVTPKDIRVAEVTEACGASVLATLNEGLDLATEGVIDALLFGPFNKAAMHAAGLAHADELHHMAERLGVSGYVSELNTLDGIWTSRVTSHVALRDVADAINAARIGQAVHLLDTTLRRSGLARPRIAVAALNPHAGDGGNFGTEEIDIIAPAVRRLAEGQMAVDGPWPSDTVFRKALAGETDAVVTMYHDQGQIALKLMGFDRGVTVQGGLPFPVATPAHGTAFDIAGQGRADVGATRAAFDLACRMVESWSAA